MFRPNIRVYRHPPSSLMLGIFSVASLACFTTYYVLMGTSGSSSSWSTDKLFVLPRSFDETQRASDFYAKWNASQLSQDNRGWLLDPIAASTRAEISGGATTCRGVHIGQIKPGFMRGNHRHHFCNETFIVWGARTKFRAENPLVKKGYEEVVIRADEVAVFGSPAGRAHALVNIDEDDITQFLGCQDSLVDGKSSETDHNVWTDW